MVSLVEFVQSKILDLKEFIDFIKPVSEDFFKDLFSILKCQKWSSLDVTTKLFVGRVTRDTCHLIDHPFLTLILTLEKNVRKGTFFEEE
jgi:hypothetical protein